MSEAVVMFLFADGLTAKVEARPGELMTQAARRAGVQLLVDCESGSCGTCVGHLVAGEADWGQYDVAVLPESDRDDGMLLPCVARVKDGAVIEFDYDAADASVEVASARFGRVASCAAVADEIWNLRVLVDEPLEFMPGQYVRLRTEPDAPWRAYSMANGPGGRELSFFVRIVPGGAFSSWLTGKAKPGDAIEIDGPRGAFFLRQEARPRLFVAGGSGLAPFLSMLRSSNDGNGAAPTTLLVGARSVGSLFAQDELRIAAAANPDLVVRTFVEHGSGPGCEAGYPTAGIATAGLGPDARVYVCGPPPMVEAARAAAEAAGLSRKEMLFERFT